MVKIVKVPFLEFVSDLCIRKTNSWPILDFISKLVWSRSNIVVKRKQTLISTFKWPVLQMKNSCNFLQFQKFYFLCPVSIY
jgi:hypothetical protein